MPVQDTVASLTEDRVTTRGVMVAKQLRPTMATSNAPLSATNLLHELDSAAQEVITAVSAVQVRGTCAILPTVTVLVRDCCVWAILGSYLVGVLHG